MRNARVYVFWTWNEKLAWIASELRQGRLRQGWGGAGTELLDDRGRLRPFEDWQATFAVYAAPWDPPPTDDEVRTRYTILKSMLEMERGDIVVVPRVPDEGIFTTVAVADGYRFDGAHFNRSAPGVPANDLGHVVAVDPESLQEHLYADSMLSKLIVSRFQFYRKAITPVRNEAYAKLIRQAHARPRGAEHIPPSSEVPLKRSGNTVELEEDVAAVFSDSRQVNLILRALIPTVATNVSPARRPQITASDCAGRRVWVLRISPWGIDRVQDALREDSLIFGWSRDDFSDPALSRVEIAEKLIKVYGDSKGSSIGNIVRFVQQMRVGDLVLVPHGPDELYICRIAGPTTYDASKKADGIDMAHRRRAEWLNNKEPLPRKKLPAIVQQKLRSQLTIYNADDISDQVDRLVR